MHSIDWLQDWFQRHCDGDWEHGSGVKIETLDNPGWSIEINLYETELEKREFNKLVVERSENDWLHCKIEGNVFYGYGGTVNFNEILDTFRNWAENK
jgi:hypothetical protein